MNGTFLSDEQQQELVAEVFRRNEALEQSPGAKTPGQSLECLYQVVEADFKIWQFFRRQLNRVRTLVDIKELLKHFHRIFGENQFVCDAYETFDLLRQKFCDFVARQHALAQERRAEVRKLGLN